MRHALTALILSSASLSFAQSQPQLTWQGYVSGSATLYIQGNSVDAQGRSTGAIDRPSHRFYAPLPARAQRVEVDVVRGDGRVLVSEQPSRRNEFSAIVRIDPRGNNYEYFVLNFYWQPDSLSGSLADQDGTYRSRDRRTPRDERLQTDAFGPQYMTWRGRVDHEALVEIRGRRANVRTLKGQRAMTDSVNFTAPLPRQELEVRLEDASGRGKIEVVQEPTPSNNYTTVVRVMDEDSGADTYAFRLAWEGDRYPNRTGTRSRTRDGITGNDSYGGVLTPSGSSGGVLNRSGSYGDNRIVWSGRVDGKVQLVFRDDRVTINRMSGARVTDDRLEIGSPLPNTPVQDFDVNKVDGRGDVRIVSQPSAYNGYALTVEISDSSAGPDLYTLEITWNR